MPDYGTVSSHGPRFREAESIESKFNASRQMTESECNEYFEKYISSVTVLMMLRPLDGKN